MRETVKAVLMRTSVRVFILLITSSFSEAAFAQGTYTWKSVIAGGIGFVSGIVYHPTARGLVYARTDIGGAYRWDTPTHRWIPLNDALDRNTYTYLGVLSVGLDRNDTNRVYLETGMNTQWWAGNGALLRSTDRGATWTTIALPFKVGGNEDGRGCGERLQVDPNAGSILFMGTSSNAGTSPSQAALWKSSNFGTSWSSVSSFAPTNVNFVLFDPASAASGNPTQRIFVSAADTSGNSLYKSTDGGTSWAVVPGQPHGVMAIRAAIGGSLLYLTFANYQGPDGATAGSVWKYNITSGAWTNITPAPAPPAQGGYSGIALNPRNPNYVIVSTLDCWYPMDEVYLSTNGGTTWSGKLRNASLDHSYAPYTSTVTPHWLASLAMDPFDSSKAMFGTGFGIWACDNIFATTPTWYFKDENLEEAATLQLISPPFTNLLSTMADYDGFRHDNLDVSPPQGRWNPPKNTTYSIGFAERVPSKIVKAYRPGYGVSLEPHNPPPYGAYSTDGGRSWMDFAGYPAGAIGGAYFGQLSICISADGETMVWSPAGAVTSYSTDNGTTWTPCNGGVSDSAQPKADPVNPRKFYIFDAISEGQLWVSTDGGKTFSRGAGGLPTVPPYRMPDGLLTTVPGYEGDLWMCTGSGGLFHSSNSGLTASKVNSVGSAWLLGAGKSSTAGGYPALYLWGIVNGTLGIFRSDNVGATWTRINDDAHQFGLLSSVTGDPRVYGRCYVSAGGRGILYGEPTGTSPTGNPTTFDFSPGPGDSLTSYHQNMNAAWSSASDPQGRALTYSMHFFGPAVDTTFVTAGNTATFSVGTIQPLSQYVLTGYASNGTNATASENAIWLNTAAVISGMAAPQRPTLASPPDAAISQSLTPTLSWATASGTVSYRLQVSANTGFTAMVFNDSTLTDTAKVVGPLQNGSTYSWRVNAKNAGGTSPWSVARNFTTIVALPQPPALAAPADSAGDLQATTTLSWNAVAGASLYRVQLSTSSAFTPTIVDDSSLTATSRVVGPLSLGTTYYWRAQAKNAAGWGQLSVTRRFSTVSTTAVEQLGSEIPKHYGLSQNYPNPFNPVTTIAFELPKAGPVTLKVFDLLGREVKTLVSQELGAGSFSVRWQADVSSGIYFFRLQAGRYEETKKMLLMK